MLKLPYGTSNFAQVADEKYYFVDRTGYIAQLEELGERYLFFLRPRRFGKTLFVSMLQCYYGLEYASRFPDFFGRFAIGQNPTPMANQYLVHCCGSSDSLDALDTWLSNLSKFL